MATWNMMMLQDPATMIMMFMTLIHNTIMEVMIFIAIFIMMLINYLLKNKSINRLMTHNNFLEIIWTILPLFILMYMAFPSLQLLYLLEETQSPTTSIKAIGHQWYWTYEYPDFKKSFDSYLTLDNSNNKFRLLEVDNRMIMPFNINSRVLCTSDDVIHSWAVPALGIKMDALPGRLNQVIIYPTSMGMFFGQCSEICGTNHSFMPISTEIVSAPLFIKWMKNINK